MPCLVSNGPVAVIVTSPERARDLRQPPVHVLGYATCASGDNLLTARHPTVETGAKRSGEMAFRMAGITRDDIGTCQLYDCYTYTVLVTLEDYGFCAKGEGGPFVADGRLGHGGSLPTNTGGVSCPVTICGPSHLCPRPWCDAGSRPERRAPGATQRPRAGQRQWRHSEFSLHADPEPSPIRLTAPLNRRRSLRRRGARDCIVVLAELGRPRRWHIVRIPASKIWTPTEDQIIPPLAVAKIG
jgi:hypothetical protein